MTNPDEPITAPAATADEPALGEEAGGTGRQEIDQAGGAGAGAPPDAATEHLVDLPDEPGEAHVAAYAAAADELAGRLDDSATGHGDNP